MKTVIISGDHGAGKTMAMLRVLASMPPDGNYLYVADIYACSRINEKRYRDIGGRAGPVFFSLDRSPSTLDSHGFDSIFLDLNGDTPVWIERVLAPDGHVYVRRDVPRGVVKERCDRIDSRVNALIESLSRRLDALERANAPLEDSKDALIRDLVGQVGNSPTYPYIEWDDRILKLRDRAEKLGVKL